MPYVDPGGAFSSGVEDFMANRALQQRQAMLDQIAMQREQRTADYQRVEQEQAAEALKRNREEAEQRNRDRRVSDFEKQVGSMVKGDIPDDGLLKEADSLGQGHIFAPDDTTGHRIYKGSAKERQEAEQRQRITDFAGTLEPNSPDARALQYEALTNRSAPAGMFRGPSADTTPVVRVNPAKRVVERLVNGAWTPVAGDVPKGAHFLQETPPKDTSAADAAKTDRDARRLDTVHEHAYTELNGLDKDFRGQLTEYDKVGAMLNQKTAQADADVAPLVLKATVGGMGSGFRMTRAEIDNTLHGRTKWEDLQATLAKFSTDPQNAVIPDSQREAIKALSRAIRSKAYNLYKQIIDVRHKIDESNDPTEIRRLRTQLQDDMFPPESEDLKPADAGVPVVGGMFNGGKVLAIRPKK